MAKQRTDDDHETPGIEPISDAHANEDVAEASAEEAPERTLAGALEEELDRALREREEFKQHWQRAQADYLNLKRRTLADADAAVRRSVQPLLEGLLLVLDNLDLALAAESTTEEARNLAVGVGLTREQLLKVLAGGGVERIDSSGDFDPALHQAVATVETSEAPPGRILETVRSGWTHQGLVLRPAHVKVATAPEPKND